MHPMTTPTGSRPKPGRNRRRGKGPAPMPSPRQVVAQALTAPPPVHTVEEPLSPQEIARLKGHFRFLREHRNLLKLRVNAAEDLLLNGVREPSHRGLCNHLLAKVERSRVLAVTQTMPPAEAVRLLGGVIRFAPDIAYILRYLECVKQTSSQAQAGAAVTEALKQIDFSQLSAAQMRQLVALIADVFAERDLPIFLFSLLYDEPFRTALDRSLDGFPEVLGKMVRPLRSVHEVVANTSARSSTERDRRDFGDTDLQAGVALLLDVNPLSLVELSDSARRRLLQLGCETLSTQPKIRSDTLVQLLESLSFSQASEQMAATVALVSALLSADHEAAAKKLIERVRKPDDTGSILARWRTALDAPRIGPVALDAARSNRELPPCGRWVRGWHIATQSVVLVRYGEIGEQPVFAEQITEWRRLLVPGVPRVIASSTTSAKRPYLAVELPGYPLNREFQKGSRVEARVRFRWAVDLCALMFVLAHQRVVLPDAELHRFNVDHDGRLWLVDLWGMRAAELEPALRAHCDHARAACLQLLKNAPCASMTEDVMSQLERAPDLLQMAQIFG